MNIGYGLNINFWNYSYLNFSFASIKLASKQRTENVVTEAKYIARTDKIIFTSDYGFQLLSSIEKKIFKDLNWENKSVLFTTGFNKEVTKFDMQNQLTLQLFKLIKIKLDQKTSYDFNQSEKIQLRFELLIGVYFQK